MSNDNTISTDTKPETKRKKRKFNWYELFENFVFFMSLVLAVANFCTENDAMMVVCFVVAAFIALSKRIRILQQHVDLVLKSVLLMDTHVDEFK